MAEQRANLAITTLAANISTTPAAGTSESWLVASTAVPFPQTGTYRATVGPNSDTTPEIVLITAVNDATHFQVQRGAESSTIKTHTSGDAFQHTLTAGALALAVWTDKVNTWVAGASSDMSPATSLILPTAAGAAPTVGGDVRYDSTQAALKGGGSGAVTGAFPRVLSVQRAVSDTMTNTTTSEQTFATTFTLPANYIIAGKGLRLTLHWLTTTGSSPVSQLFKVKMGSVAILTAVSAVTPGVSVTGRAFSLTFDIFGTAAPGAAAGIETWAIATFSTSAHTNSLTQPVNIATNASQALGVSITYGGTGGADSVTLREYLLEELN